MATIVFALFSSCRDEAPPPMLWEVSDSGSDQVKVEMSYNGSQLFISKS